jgi:hypothetical protein
VFAPGEGFKLAAFRAVSGGSKKDSGLHVHNKAVAPERQMGPAANISPVNSSPPFPLIIPSPQGRGGGLFSPIGEDPAGRGGGGGVATGRCRSGRGVIRESVKESVKEPCRGVQILKREYVVAV